MHFTVAAVSALAALANMVAAGPMGNPVDGPSSTLSADGEASTPPADAHIAFRRDDTNPAAGLPSIDSDTILNDVSRNGSPLLKREGYECKGSVNCKTWPNFKRDCDRAVNTALVRTDAVNYGGSNSGLRKGSRTGKCEVFIEGPGTCQTTGNQMWKDYQDIRSHGCGICGFKTWGEHDECRTKIDFVLSG